MASSQQAGTALLEVEPEQPKHGDRATATNVQDAQDGAANGEQSAEVPAGLPSHVDEDGVGESALRVDLSLEGRSDPNQDFLEPSTGVKPGETSEIGDRSGAAVDSNSGNFSGTVDDSNTGDRSGAADNSNAGDRGVIVDDSNDGDRDGIGGDSNTGERGSVSAELHRESSSHQRNILAITAQRQLQGYLPDPPGQEPMTLDRTYAQIEALRGVGLLSDDSSTSPTGEQLEQHLQEATSWFMGLMATGQRQSIGRPLADVETGPHQLQQSHVASSQGPLDQVIIVAKYGGLVAHQTFETVTVPPERKAVKSKWVFRWKLGSEGDVVRAKARLVAKGFSQVASFDFDEPSHLVPSLPQ